MAKLIFNPDEDRPIEAYIHNDDPQPYDLVEGIDPEATEILVEDEDTGHQFLVILEGSEFELEPNTIYAISPLATESEEVVDNEPENDAEAEEVTE